MNTTGFEPKVRRSRIFAMDAPGELNGSNQATIFSDQPRLTGVIFTVFSS